MRLGQLAICFALACSSGCSKPMVERSSEFPSPDGQVVIAVLVDNWLGFGYGAIHEAAAPLGLLLRSFLR